MLIYTYRIMTTQIYHSVYSLHDEELIKVSTQ